MEGSKNITEFPADFKILFEKLEDLRNEHQELFTFGAQSDVSLPESIREIKKIVEACNEQNSFTTFTRA